METFDFFKTENEYVYNIDVNIFLRLKRTNHSVAVLYFTDEINNQINISDDIVVYTYDFQDKKKKLIQKPIKNNYALCW